MRGARAEFDTDQEARRERLAGIDTSYMSLDRVAAAVESIVGYGDGRPGGDAV